MINISTQDNFKKKGPLVEDPIESVFGKKYNFELSIDPKSKSGLRGLPDHLEKQMLIIFKKEEIMNDPEKVLQCILEGEILKGGHYMLPDESFAHEQIDNVTVFKREDPSKNYHVVSRIAEGGFAKVFKVQRHTDEKQFALKFIEPKNKKDY